MAIDLVIAAGVAGLRRAVGPTSWVVLEELLHSSEPANEGLGSTRASAASVRVLAGRLDLDKDTVARAIRRLLDAGVVGRAQDRASIGTFARISYVIRLPDGLSVVDSHHTFTTTTVRSSSRSTGPASQLSFLDL